MYLQAFCLDHSKESAKKISGDSTFHLPSVIQATLAEIYANWNIGSHCRSVRQDTFLGRNFSTGIGASLTEICYPIGYPVTLSEMSLGYPVTASELSWDTGYPRS